MTLCPLLVGVNRKQTPINPTHKKKTQNVYCQRHQRFSFWAASKNSTPQQKKIKKILTPTLQKVQTKEFKSRKYNERDFQYYAKHACRCHTGKWASLCERSERSCDQSRKFVLLRSVRSKTLKHTHTHTHTISLSHTYTLSLFLSLYLSLSFFENLSCRFSVLTSYDLALSLATQT